MHTAHRSVLLLPLLLGACAVGGAPSGPAPQPARVSAELAAVAGAYRLVLVNGQALPVFTGAYENCREYVVRGTLTLGTDGRYEMAPTMREVCDGQVEVNREGQREIGTYTVEGSTIRLREGTIEREGLNRWEGADSGGGDIPIENLGGTATLEGGTLVVRLADDEATATFRR